MGPILYSTNPWIAHEFSMKYRAGIHFVWCSEYFDPSTASSVSSAALIAPSSSPVNIFRTLKSDCEREDSHSSLIKNYRKTFTRLAKSWLADGSITAAQCDEMIATVKSKSWRIWRPVLYIIPSENIIANNRLQRVNHKSRASYGEEMQIIDLAKHEFDIIEGPL